MNRRRILTFGSLVVCAVVAVVLGSRFYAIHQRNNAIRFIESRGGSVARIGMYGVRPDWSVRRIILSRIGVSKEAFDRFLETVGVRKECWGVSCKGSGGADDIARACRAFDIVGSFWARETDLTDSGLATFADLDVRELIVDNTAVTSDGVKKLKDNMSLRMLFLSGTDVSDDGIREIVPLGRDGKLHTLRIAETNVTEESFAFLQSKIPGCTILWWPKETATRTAPENNPRENVTSTIGN